MVPQQRGDSTVYDSQVCHHRLAHRCHPCYSVLHTSESMFSHTSPHDALGLGRKTKLCALGSDSMCSEHVKSWLSGLYITVHVLCDLLTSTFSTRYFHEAFWVIQVFHIRNVRSTAKTPKPSKMNFSFCAWQVGWEWPKSVCEIFSYSHRRPDLPTLSPTLLIVLSIQKN